MRSSEIGSEFWDVPVGDTPARYSFPMQEATWTRCGRDALTLILRDIKTTAPPRLKCAVPSYCCDSMIKPFLQEGYSVVFYPAFPRIGNGVECDFSVASDCEVILTLDYFGYHTDNSFDDYGGIIISDLTHSVFSDVAVQASYYFGSLRKWAGFWGGGFAIRNGGRIDCDLPPADESRFFVLRERAMLLKRKYMEGESVSKGSFLERLEDAESILESTPPARGLPRDTQLALKVDAGLIRERRRRNAQVLLDYVSEFAIFPEISQRDIPMFVPIMVRHGKRDELRSFLIGKDIYCPIHWPVTDAHPDDAAMRETHNCELSLVCDQRYTEADMRRLGMAIREFYGEG